jgi:hypothetical protein
MKRFSTLALVAVLAIANLVAQTSDIIVFSDAGEKFTLLVDGSVQNAQPAARVEARNIKNATPLLVVNFADAAIPQLKQNGWMEPGQEYTLRITTNKKGQRVLRMQGQTALGSAPADQQKPSPDNFTEDGSTTTGSSTTQTTGVPGSVNTTTTVTTTDGTVGQNVNMNIGVNGVGVTMTVNDGMGGTTTTTTTTTTTSSSSNVSSTQVQEQDAPVVTSSTGSGCAQPMSTADFNEAVASINDKGFEETKLTLAKQIGGSNCFSSAQVKTIMGLFGYEDSKLDFAKFAYDHVSDRNNYFKVNDAFGFSSSVDELNKYIQSR